MLAPVLITPPAMLPVSLDEAKAHLRVEEAITEDDALIEGLIRAATDHLDGWTGILGRCLVEQEWRHNSDVSGSCVMLPLGPVIEIVSATNGPDTIDPADYTLKTDAGGRSRVEFGVSISGLVNVTYKVGYATIPQDDGPPVVPAQSTVPAALKVAILLLVGNWYANRETIVVGATVEKLPFAVESLIAPYRRVGV